MMNTGQLSSYISLITLISKQLTELDSFSKSSLENEVEFRLVIFCEKATILTKNAGKSQELT